MERPEEYLPLDLSAKQFVEAYVSTVPSSTPEERKIAYKRYKERRDEAGVASPTSRSPVRSPRKSKSPVRRKSPRRVPYGGLASATLTGLPRELQGHIASFLPEQATGRIQRVSRAVKKTSEERLREVCEGVPTLGEIRLSGFYSRKLVGGQRVAFLDTTSDTLYVSVFLRAGITELHSRDTTRTITPGLKRLGGEEVLDILEGLYRRLPRLAPSLLLLERTLSRRKSCRGQGQGYLLDAVLHIVDLVSRPYLYPVVGVEFSELLSSYVSSVGASQGREERVHAFEVPLVKGVEERRDIDLLRWRILLLRGWFNPYEIEKTEQENARTEETDLFMSSSILDMLNVFQRWSERVVIEYRV